MTMKKTLSTLVLAGAALFATGQQMTFNSQYMVNHYLLNPGAAGTLDYLPIATSFRQQWAGFEGAPKTQTLSAHSSIGESMGVGGILYNDVTGPLRNIGFQGSYAYRFKVNDKSKISLGLSMALSQYYLDGGEFILNDAVDQTLNGVQQKSFNPDANFGAYYYGENYFAGLVASQLFEYKFKFGDNIEDMNRQVRHYYLNGGYRFKLNNEFMLEPSALLKYVSGAPMQFDVNTRVFYKENLWAGLSYRHQDAMVCMLGVKRDQFVIGYSYDYTMSNIRNYAGGTHEIYLEFQLSKKKSEASFE